MYFATNAEKQIKTHNICAYVTRDMPPKTEKEIEYLSWMCESDSDKIAITHYLMFIIIIITQVGPSSTWAIHGNDFQKDRPDRNSILSLRIVMTHSKISKMSSCFSTIAINI